jgi:hypothetical protein
MKKLILILTFVLYLAACKQDCKQIEYDLKKAERNLEFEVNVLKDIENTSTIFQKLEETADRIRKQQRIVDSCDLVVKQLRDVYQKCNTDSIK